MDDTLTRSLATHSEGEEVASKWHTRGDLFFFQLVSVLFPITDHKHTVVTPMLVLMARSLNHCPVFNTGDILAGAFTCSMVLSFLKPAGRFCPEILPFLTTLLRAVLGPKDSKVTPRFNPVRGILLLSKSTCSLKPQRMALTSIGEEEALNDQSRLDVQALLLRVLQAAVEATSELQSAPELLEMVTATLKDTKSALGKNVKPVLTSLEDTIQTVQNKVRGARKSLQWQIPKPKTIRLMNPRFDEHFNPDRSADPVKERAEEKKAKQRMNRDVKHAKRELHQDAVALAEVRSQKQALKDSVKADKMHKHLAELESQQQNFKDTGGIMNDNGKDKPKPHRETKSRRKK